MGLARPPDRSLEPQRPPVEIRLTPTHHRIATNLEMPKGHLKAFVLLILMFLSSSSSAEELVGFVQRLWHPPISPAAFNPGFPHSQNNSRESVAAGYLASLSKPNSYYLRHIAPNVSSDSSTSLRHDLISGRLASAESSAERAQTPTGVWGHLRTSRQYQEEFGHLYLA